MMLIARASVVIALTLGLSSAFAPTTTTCRPATTTTSSLFLSAADNKKPPAGHDTGGSSATDLPEEVRKQAEAYQIHQTEQAPKLDFATDVRTTIQYNHGFAVMSTHSKSDPEYPSGSVVGFAPDEQGRPLFIFSGMSTHTQDLLVNPHCSLTVAAKNFKGAADARVNLMGRTELIKDEDEIEKAKETYLKKHPGAFWVNFGDFNWFRMEVDKVRFVGGFARAGSVTPEEYTNAKPDPVSEYGPMIAQHMNEDHMEANIAIVKAVVPAMTGEDVPEISEAIITQVDSLGMFVKVTREAPVAFLPQQFKVRVPFPRPAENRKDVKTLIVEMTQSAAKADA